MGYCMGFFCHRHQGLLSLFYVVDRNRYLGKEYKIEVNVVSFNLLVNRALHLKIDAAIRLLGAKERREISPLGCAIQTYFIMLLEFNCGHYSQVLVLHLSTLSKT